MTEDGNAAALRVALGEARKVIEAMGGYWARETLPIIDAALDAPPRNCDVGTPEEQSVRMAEFCRAQYKKSDGVMLCSGCQFHNREGLDCQFAWAQLPYEAEGGVE